jgi:glycosyltransferase involved in cell wall biosynthesis
LRLVTVEHLRLSAIIERDRCALALSLSLKSGMITIFTPSFADEANTNAQNLSTKEIVARLDPERFAVTMLHAGAADPRIAVRKNTSLLQTHERGTTVRAVWHILRNVPDIYFFPREGPLDAAFLHLRHYLRWKTAVVSYVVSGGLHAQPYAPARVRHIREADVVVANNGYLARLVKEKMNVDASVIHNGIDRRFFFAPETGRAGREAVTVLYAGSMRPYKRVPVVVQQAARWPHVQFRIAGIGEEEQICKNLAAKLGCGNVEFLGHLPLARLGEEMRRADIFLFPSIIEGHPQVLGQAAASGLPAVAMKIYHPDYVVEGATGFLVDGDDELGAKLDLLIRDPKTRLAMGEAAIAHAQKFDWGVIAGKWQEVFERAVAQRQRN